MTEPDDDEPTGTEALNDALRRAAGHGPVGDDVPKAKSMTEAIRIAAGRHTTEEDQQ